MRRAGFAIAVLVLGVWVAATMPAAAQTPSPSPEDEGESATYRGTDPARDLRAYEPKPLEVVRDPEKVAGLKNRLAIRLSTTAIELVRGASVLRSIAFDASDRVAFDDIARAVDDPEWVEDLGDGQFLLRAAFAQAPGTSVLFGGSGTRVVRMANRPHVFLGGVDAVVRFEDVTVTSWDEEAGDVVTDYRDGRPFILYENGSTLDVVRSEIAYLGYDRTTAYGLSWRENATGSLRRSDVHHNFFGVYTFESHDIEFRNNTLRDNVYYGLDPHDFSSGLVVAGNEAYGNGSHGIIFSRGVVDSVVRDNHVHDNDGNGIVMDFESDGNLIEQNRSEGNTGDGIVVLGSSDTLVRGNEVRGNRVGIRLNNEGFRNTIQDNTVEGNGRGIEIYGGAFQTRSLGNRIRGSTEAGLVIEEADAISREDLIEGSPVGIEIRSPARIEGAVVRDADVGVLVTERGIAELSRVDVEAGEIGLELEPGSVARMWSSTVSAPDPMEGTDLRIDAGNDLRRPLSALPWLALAGLGFVSLAVALHVLHRVRSRGSHRVFDVPMGVRNAR